MRQDVEDAVDAGAGVLRKGPSFADTEHSIRRRESLSRINTLAVLRAVLQELPDDMTVFDLLDEIQSELVRP